MTTAYFVKKARTDIYVFGKKVEREHKAGKNKGKMFTTFDRSQPANKKDRILIKRGESYYWWQFAFSPKQYSKERPSRSQLTRSEFLGWLYDMEDNQIGNATASNQSDLESLVDEWVSEIENMRDELQSKLDNMPEQLKDSSDSGMTLQERIEGLDTWISDLEGIDLEIDEDSLREVAKGQVADEVETDTTLDEISKLEDERFEELLQEEVDEKFSELQNCSSGL